MLHYANVGKAGRQNSGEKLGFGETGERTRPEPKKTSEVNFNEDLCTCGDVKSVLLCFTWHYLYNAIDQKKKKQDKTSKEERKVCNDLFTNDRSHDYLVDFHLKLDVTSRPLILLTLTANVARQLLLDETERNHQKNTKFKKQIK